AESFLKSAGIEVASLSPPQDSVVAGLKRTDHVFRWAMPSASLAGARGDTAAGGVRVTVARDQVTDFRYTIALPRAFLRAVKGTTWEGWIDTGLIVLAIALVIAAFVATVQRQRTDELQWRAAWRFGGAVVFLAALTLLFNRNVIVGGASARVLVV